MPRPWDNRNYSEEDIAMNYGPAVAPNGTTREEFYDSMAAHGWNKPGDDQAIAHMYMKLISLMSTNNADRGAMIALMSRTVNSPADKLTVIRDIASRPALVPNANEQLANDDRRYEFIVNMQVRGFNKPGDEELLGTVSSLPNKVTRGNEEFLNPEQRRFFNLMGRTYRGDTIPERQAFLNGVNRYYDIELSEAEKEDHRAERAAVDQQISKYDRFVNNGVNNDTLGAALEEEERRRTARNIYYDTKERLHENVREPYRRFMDIYGPNAALPENLAFTDREAYNNIALPVPEGLDELTVTAIMIGACMNPSRLGKGEFNNVIGGGNSLSSDQMLFMSNVPTNHSTEAAAKFGPVMLEARKEALEALQRYQQGDPSAAKALLKNFADYEYSSLISSGIAADTMNQSTVNPEQSGHKLFAEVMEKDALGLSQEYGSKANDIPNLRTKVFGKAFDAMTAAENGRKNILNGFFDMNEEEKEEAVEDMLLSQYISLIPKKVSQERNKDVDETLSNALLRHGIAPDTALGQADMDFSLKLRDVYARGTITDIEVFVAENDMQQIKDLYLPEIRKSARYKAIMGSKNKDELADNIIAAEKDMQAAGKTVAELLPGVKLPNGAEKYNSVMEYGFEKDCLRIKKDYVKEVCFGENGLFKDELDDFAPASNKSEDIKKCYINFMKMKKEIDKIDDDSKEFNSIKHYTKKLGQTLEALSKKRQSRRR